jgi:uncharacterized protein
MTPFDRQDLSFDEFDEINHPRPAETDFDRIAANFLSRRTFLKGTAVTGASAFVLGSASLAGRKAQAAAGWLDFEPIAPKSIDVVTVPKGFKADVLIRWGDPLWSCKPAFDPATRGTGESQETAFGDNSDGMALFATAGGKTVLAVNNEYVNRSIMFGNRDGGKPANADDVRKGKAGHGVSVFEIAQQGGSGRSWRWCMEANERQSPLPS